MKNLAIACTGLLASSIAMADNLEGTDDLLCAAGHVQICFENGECFSVTPWELSMPDFVVIDMKAKTVSTTKASGQNRSSPFTSVKRSDGVISLQGVEAGLMLITFGRSDSRTATATAVSASSNFIASAIWPGAI